MSHGFLIENELGRRVVDENTPIFVVEESTVTQTASSYFDSEYSSSTIGRVRITYRFARPYRGISPPMVFIWAATDVYNNARVWMGDWYNNVVHWAIGSPGNWTSVVVSITLIVGRGRVEWNANDFRRYFIVAGAGIEPRPGEVGLVVRNAAGVAVFNSNTNILEVRGYSNNWSLQSKVRTTAVGGDFGAHLEVWQLSEIVPVHGDWVLVSHPQTYRRYNGERGFSWVSRIKTGTTILQSLQTGNSGTPVHRPVILARPRLPVYYSYNADGSLRWGIM